MEFKHAKWPVDSCHCKRGAWHQLPILVPATHLAIILRIPTPGKWYFYQNHSQKIKGPQDSKFVTICDTGGCDYLIEAAWRIYASVNRPSLVQIMACRLVGTKPLSEPMQEIVNWNLKIVIFLFKKMRLKMLSAKWQPFCLSLNVLRQHLWHQWWQTCHHDNS